MQKKLMNVKFLYHSKTYCVIYVQKQAGAFTVKEKKKRPRNVKIKFV